jgi:hypothetical protein
VERGVVAVDQAEKQATTLASGKFRGDTRYHATWLEATSNQRGAMMATVRCEHPDIKVLLEIKLLVLKARH